MELKNFTKLEFGNLNFTSPKTMKFIKKIPGLKKIALLGLEGLKWMKQVNENIKKLKAEIGEETYNKLPGNFKGTDPFYGGILIVGPGNVLTFSRFDQYSLDWFPNSELLKSMWN